ncbi:hypothetical protein [Hymenobacter sp. UYCo722]|uniref:hypothetical protein n=1 Tax=Hymenobacter sp. UYCo722 TaxID=3156335 RepID=UPI003399DA4F
MAQPAVPKPAFVAEPGLLVARWPGESSPVALQAEYEALLGQATTAHASRWLLDVRRRAMPPLDLLNWIVLNWLPRAAARYPPGSLAVAYLVAPERATAFAADTYLAGYLHDALAPDRHYRVALFDDEARARHWLLA